jgi:hypothetical protein
MTEADQLIGRDSAGRFLPRYSGNPAGKSKGTLNRATVLAAALRDGEDETIARVIIDKALAGNAAAARFCLDRLYPKPRGRPITLDLPATGGRGDVVAAFNATLRAMADGEITPDEAVVISRFLDGRRRVLQAWQLEEKLTAYGRTIPGDGEGDMDEDDEFEEDDLMDDDVQEDGQDEEEPLMERAAGGDGERESPEESSLLGEDLGTGLENATGEPVKDPPAPLLSACISPPPVSPPLARKSDTIRGAISWPYTPNRVRILSSSSGDA